MAKLYKSKAWMQMAEQCAYNAGLLAESLQISRRQLERRTMKFFGQSPHDWLQDQRILKASDELKKHGCVKLVAANMAFKQVSHFSREFKRRYGVSPAKFLDQNF